MAHDVAVRIQVPLAEADGPTLGATAHEVLALERPSELCKKVEAVRLTKLGAKARANGPWRASSPRAAIGCLDPVAWRG
jgi:hypothetical protein